MTDNKKIAEQKFGGKTLAAWQGFINTSLKKTVEATFDSAKRIAAYKAVVDDDTFKTTMKEWYGFTASHISYWAKINENAARFEKYIQILPASPRSLYELSAIEPVVFEELVTAGKIKPSLTVESIKELKASGGKIKTFLLKYSDSEDYLDICRESDRLKAEELTADEHIKQLATWIRANKIKAPAKEAPAPKKTIPVFAEDDDGLESENYEGFNDDDDFSEDYEGFNDDNADMAGWAMPNPREGEVLLAMTRENAYAMFGIYLNKPLDNVAVERALIAQAGDDESLQRALEVIAS
jgi:hypothetical protein